MTAPLAPCPRPFNMAAHVLARAGDRPDKTALAVLGPDGGADGGADGAETWSYARLAGAVRGIATGLMRQGLTPGDRVLMRLDNTPEFPLTYLACIAVGLVPVPTSAQLTAPEIGVIAAEIGPKLIVASPGVALPRHDAPVLEAAALAGFHDLPPADFAIGDPDRPAYIIYTSGTSGRPRAVVHAHRAIWARRMMWQGWYGLTAEDRLLHAGAFNWTYTLGTGLMDPWATGATALIPAPGTPATALPGLLSSHGATIFAAAPGIYRQILRADLPALPALRHGLSAGEKLPETLRVAWAKATGTELHEAFGMSECSTFISGSPTAPAPPATLGRPQPGRRVALLDAGGPVTPGQTGTIAIHATDPGLMLGYLDQPRETAARFQGDWFVTGDLGRADASGAIRYMGRADDMMNAGGYRVSPVEVEEALAPFPGLSEVAAVELRVKADTTVIAAFYTAADLLDEAALRRFAAARLARYKCPRLFIHAPRLPRGANNKLLRRRLRQDWDAAHGYT